MKYALVIATGAADLPQVSLGGKTPLEYARTQALDRIAASGRLGTVVPVPPGTCAASDGILLSLLGYDPESHGARRGALEAVGLGVSLAPDDLALRFNLVTVHDGKLIDPAAGHVARREAELLIQELGRAAAHRSPGSYGLEFHPGGGYHGVMVVRGGADLSLELTPPYQALRRPLVECTARGPDSGWLNELIDWSREIFADHEVNRVRRSLGEHPATEIWPWGAGGAFTLPSFSSLHGVEAALVAAVPLALGVGRSAGMHVLAARGTGGDIDSELEAKAAAALELLAEDTLVIVHVQGAQEASNRFDPRAKAAFLERFDNELLSPLARGLEASGPYRLLVTCDHATSSDLERPAGDWVPFALCGDGVEAVRGWPFAERKALDADLCIDEAGALVPFLLGPWDRRRRIASRMDASSE